jgi:hypothetical protein
MNSTTVATVVAAGLAMASLAAGGIALWLHRRGTLATPPTPQRPTNPEPRKRASSMRDEAPSAFEESFSDLGGSPERGAREPSPAKPPPYGKSPDREAPKPWPVDPNRFAARQAELDAELERQRRASEVQPLEPRPSPASTKVRTSSAAAAPTSRAVEPINRKRRYSVRPGQPIEVVVGDAPPGTVWRSSRNDVEVQVIEHRGERLRFTLHGPSGDVNVGLVQDGVKRPRAVRSWKFELCDAA